MRGPQVLAGIDAELVGEQMPSLLVRRERLGLPPGGVQRGHPQGDQALAQGIARAQSLELGHRFVVTTEGDVRREEVLAGREVELLESGLLGGGEWRARHVIERRAAPQGERPSEHVGGGDRLLGLEQVTSLVGLLREDSGVHAGRVDREAVAGGGRLQERGIGQCSAEPGDQGLQGVGLVGDVLAVPEGAGRGSVH